MSLFSITYSSVRSGDFAVESLVDLAERASAYNAVSDVTGFLCHADGRYLQTIEGDYEEVNRIYHRRIAAARSHRDLCLIHIEPQTQRRFANWGMGFANVTPADHALLQRYFPGGIMQPERIGGLAAIEFLQALSASEDRLPLG